MFIREISFWMEFLAISTSAAGSWIYSRGKLISRVSIKKRKKPHSWTPGQSLKKAKLNSSPESLFFLCSQPGNRERPGFHSARLILAHFSLQFLCLMTSKIACPSYQPELIGAMLPIIPPIVLVLSLSVEGRVQLLEDDIRQILQLG